MLRPPLNYMFERHMTAYRIAQFTVETNLKYHSSPDTTASHAKPQNCSNNSPFKLADHVAKAVTEEAGNSDQDFKLGDSSLHKAAYHQLNVWN